MASASSWWGGLTEQISTMAKDVLTEGTEEIDDHATALQLEQKKTSELQNQNVNIKGENESLRVKVVELNDSLHSAELQISAVSSEYKGLLQDREEELKALKHTIEELNESNRSLLSSNNASATRGRSHYHHFNQSEHSHTNGELPEETEDITDVLSHQQEINRLNSELERSRAEVLHWKRESKRTTTPQEGTCSQSAVDSGFELEKERLLLQIQSVEERLLAESDKHQQELSAIEELHRQRLAGVQQSHSKQIEELQSELAQATVTVVGAEQDGEEKESQTELHQRIEQLEEEGSKLYEQLQQSQEELTAANAKITEYVRKAQDEQALHKKQLQEALEGKMREQAASVSERLEEKEKECESYKRELDELKGESSVLNQSLTELDKEHEVIVSQLIQQRDELKHRNTTLSAQLSEQEERCEVAERQQRESAEQLQVLKQDVVVVKEEAGRTENGSGDERADLQRKLVESDGELKMAKELLDKHKGDVERVKVLEEDLKKAKTENCSLKDEIDQLQCRVSDDSGKISQLKTELSTADGRIEQLQSLIDKLNADLDQSQRRNAELDTLTLQLKTDNSDLNDRLGQSQADNDELKQRVSESEQRVSALTLSLSQSESKVDALDTELIQSKMTESESDSTSELSSMQQNLQAKIDENLSLENSLHSLTSQLDTVTKSLQEHEQSSSAFQQTITDLKEGMAQSADKLSRLSQDLVSKDGDISDLSEQLEKTQARLLEVTQSNSLLSGEVKEKAKEVGELERDAERKVSEISSLTTQFTHLQQVHSSVDSELTACKLDLERGRAELDSRGGEVDTLKSQLALSADTRAVLEAEVAELTSQLASSSIDSEPVDPEPSEEDMQSPRHSGSSLSEVQELKNQLAELQELLAQKVLLINELKGDEDDGDDVESITSPGTAGLQESSQQTDCVQAGDVRCRHEVEAENSLQRMDLQLEKVKSELSAALQEVEEGAKVKEQLIGAEARCHNMQEMVESLRNGNAAAETALKASKADVESLGVQLSEAEREAATSLDSISRQREELSLKVSELAELRTRLQVQESATAQLNETSHEADSKLAALQAQLDERSTALSSANDSSREKAGKIDELLAQIAEASSLRTEHLDEIAALTSSLVEKDENIRSLSDELSGEKTHCSELQTSLTNAESHSEELQSKMAECDVIISDLNRQLVEQRQQVVSERAVRSAPDVTSYADPHALAEQLRCMEVEREQMSGVLSEKSREISGLKKQLHSLMDVNSSRDAKDAETAEMTKNAIRKLSAIVNERDVEIEALKQKNDSLVSILQAPSGAQVNGGESPQQISKLLEERQSLTQQVAALSSEREQLFSALQIKHQEAVTFHAEAVRLANQLQEGPTVQSTSESGEVSGELEKLRADYHERKQQLVETQHKLSEYKQKCSELSSQLESAARTDNVPKTAYDSVRQELEVIKSKLEKQKEALLEKDKTYQDMQLRLSSQSESLSLAQSECATLRKQIENLTFELSETRAERDDKTDSVTRLEAQIAAHDTTIKSLRSAELELQRNVKDRERELTQLSSQVSGKEGDVDAEQEKQRQLVSTLTSERDTAHLTAQQNYQACQDLQAALSTSNERVHKLEREVERLRSHLMSIEEGYTADLLQSEEREKELRNRLAAAEEKAAHTSTAVQHASLEASKQISSLEDQLHAIAAQRDSSLLQLSNSQEQCAQYSTQLANLEIVLEQFQTEKDSMHAAELSKLHSTISENNSTISNLQGQLSHLQGQLDGQCEALEAAQRLTQQLEKKEEAMNALRDEVGMRESALREAEERIRRLSSNNESKVEKLLVKNLIINWHTAPGAKKPEVLLLMARVLSFTEDEKSRVGLGERQGWIGGIWQRLAHPVPTSPVVLDKSFSELFVKFLESESAPKPTPLPLPVDRMVEEEKQRAEQHHRAAFNPFVAPAASGVAATTSTAARHQTHPLLVGVPRDGSPLYTSSQPMGNPLTLSPHPTNQLSASQPLSNQQQASGLSTNPLAMQQLNSLTTNALTAPQTGGISLTPVPASAAGVADSSVRFIPIPTTSTPVS